MSSTVDSTVSNIIEAYYSNVEYAQKVDKYIKEYMNDDTYTLDDIEGILLTLPICSIHKLILL